MWKEAVEAYFKEIYNHLPGGTKENQEKAHNS
jgi:hypothetical protein